MKPSPAVSRAVWLLLAGSLALLAGVLAVRHFRPVRDNGSRTVLAGLRAERDALPDVDPAELTRWRQRQTALAAESWSETTLSALQSRIGPHWRWTAVAERGDQREFELAGVAPAGLPWAKIIATLASLEATPGLTVEAVAIATAGTRSVRNFSAVEIRVTLRWAGPGHTVAPVSPSPDRRDRVRPTAGGAPEAAAGRRARPASPRFAVHFAARARLTGGSVSGSARSRGRPDHPRLVRVGGTNQGREPNPSRT